MPKNICDVANLTDTGTPVMQVPRQPSHGMTTTPCRAIKKAMRNHHDSLPDGVYFDAVLVPHRSLPRWGYVLLIGGFALAMAAVGLAFWNMGAWPVAGFCGLEVFLVWGAFQLNYRSGRRIETVRLDEATLRIDRFGPSGRSRYWTFEPGWVRVSVEQKSLDATRLVLSSHGRYLQIGAFLTDDERRDLADALGAALVCWRSAPQDG
jgi:uncharacterized membrane protein